MTASGSSPPAYVMDGSPVLEGDAPYDTPPDQPRHHFEHPQAIDLSAEHSELVAQDDDLEVPRAA